MTHGSLFSGIGGFDLAAEWMGWENLFHCEWNPFGQKVLHHYWPNAQQFTDITKTDFKPYANRIDILTGGFPCQPYSTAGKRLGKADERHLWPHMLRAIEEIQPRWVVGENVLGLVNWSGGLVFHEVQADLEAAGYEVWPYVLPAASVNAPHRRDRVWFVAYATGNGRGWAGQGIEAKKGLQQKPESDGQLAGGLEGLCGNRPTSHPNSNGQHGGNREHEINTGEGWQYAQRDIEQGNGNGDVTNTCNEQLQGCKFNGSTKSARQTETNGRQFSRPVCSAWQNFPTQSPICNVNDGISAIMERNINSKIYATIKERYTDKNLQEVWIAFQQKGIQWEIGRLYKIHDPSLLFKTLQLCSTTYIKQNSISDFSEETSKELLRKLSKFGSFTNTPQGRELEQQFTRKFANTLPNLSHEIALVTMETERASKKFASWHRNESIKAAGNAIVPQVVFQIFKTISDYDRQTSCPPANK